MFWKRKKTNLAAGPVEFFIVGLGNPGREYQDTRHNVGYLAVERLAQELGVKIDRLKFKSLCGEGQIDGHRVLLMKPSTFMNRSGEAVCEAMRFYKIPAEKTLILLDDVSLDAGRLRIRRQGSDGGHNGMKNVIYLSGKDTFPRIKIGIGQKPHPDYDLAAWVLGRFSQQDAKIMDKALDAAVQAAILIVQGKEDQAMNQFNSMNAL
jgi:PTH1 family peptidyl-tRNA hydrolase